MRAAAFSLVELLVAMTLMLLVSAGTLALLAQGRSTLRSAESVSRIEEAADAALALLGEQLQLAGYLGLAAPGSPVEGASPAGRPERADLAVSGGCGPSLAQDLAVPLTAADGAYRLDARQALTCRPLPAGRTMPGADTLTVRHASAEAVAATSGRLQLETTGRYARLAADGTGRLGKAARWHDLEVSVYYISADSSLGSGLPSLRRKRLVGGTRPAFQDEELAPGIEDLQLEFGLDGDGDGVLERWITPATLGPQDRVRAVRIAMTVRSDIVEAGQYRRKTVTRSFELRNAVGR